MMKMTMMTTIRRRLGLALVALLPLTFIGCGKGTYLEVQLTGTNLPEIHAIGIDLTLMSADAAAVHSSDLIKRDKQMSVITLPTSMAFQLDSESGLLNVLATALGAQSQEVARASKTTPIMHAKTWNIVLNLEPATTLLSP